MASPTVLSTGAKQHAARVARLYRHALKNIASWAVDRQLFWEEVRKRADDEAMDDNDCLRRRRRRRRRRLRSFFFAHASAFTPQTTDIKLQMTGREAPSTVRGQQEREFVAKNGEMKQRNVKDETKQ